MPKRGNKKGPGRSIRLVLVGLICLGLLVALLIRGANIALFNPKGLIAGEQRRLIILSVVLLLEIAIPTLTVFYFTAWKYRESNQKTTFTPNVHHDKTLVFGIWALPSITMLLMVSVMWPAAHKLAPQKLISSSDKPLTIEVIAMRWKWLFIYPEQKIAAVNFVQIPVGTPIEFELSADETPMSSFWIPQLGGQLYAMTGHTNRLNLLAEKQGDFTGRSAEINGAGFAGMVFTARASSTEVFDSWVEDVKQSASVLSNTEYTKLLTPTEYNKAAFYSQAGSDIYDNMLLKYSGSHGQHTEYQ